MYFYNEMNVYVYIVYASDLPGIEGGVNDKERCSHSRNDILREEALQKTTKEYVNIALYMQKKCRDQRCFGMYI